MKYLITPKKYNWILGAYDAPMSNDNKTKSSNIKRVTQRRTRRC